MTRRELTLSMMTIKDVDPRARCDNKRFKICDFIPILEDETMIAERCGMCGRKIHFNKKDGKYDNKLYGQLHIRSFLQPYGSMKGLFEEIHGMQGVERATESLKKKEAADQRMKDMPDVFKEKYREVKRYYDRHPNGNII